MGEFAARLTGSSDLYQDDGRRPYASVNFVTAHDGFTLNDLVSYNEKHNEANGEGGRDGADDNNSWNCGVEGPTDDDAVRTLRQRQRRNFLATLFLSQGVPMLLHGDEMGRTQYGNNNGYCQDSEISWMEWAPEKSDLALMAYTGELSALRAAHPVFRRRRFFNGRGIRPAAPSQADDDYQRDIAWFTSSGEEMTDEDWEAGSAAVLTVFLNGEGILESDQRGERVVDDSFLLIFNAHHEDVEVTLPGSGLPDRWAHGARHRHRHRRRRDHPDLRDHDGRRAARRPRDPRRGRLPHHGRALDAALAADGRRGVSCVFLAIGEVWRTRG